MTATVAVALLFLVSFAASILLWALFLRVGLYWAKVSDVTKRRVALATVLVVVIQLALAVASLFVPPTAMALALVVGAVDLIGAVLIPCLVIVYVFKASFLRAFQAWLATLLAPAIMIAFVLFIFRPFLVEAFTNTTNSMAPTLLGNHWRGACATCGSPAYCTPLPEEYAYGYLDFEPPLMICRDNFHVGQSAGRDEQVFPADRFLVAKFLKPRRWDIVAFRLPENPSILYVKRLVGLPGEEIVIQQTRSPGHMIAGSRASQYATVKAASADQMAIVFHKGSEYSSTKAATRIGNKRNEKAQDNSITKPPDSSSIAKGSMSREPAARIPIQVNCVHRMTRSAVAPLRFRGSGRASCGSVCGAR